MIPIQRFSSGVLTEIVRRQPSSPGRTSFAWQLAVGPALARAISSPQRSSEARTVSTPSRNATVVARAREVILARLQRVLGPEQVRTLRVER